MRFRTMPVSRRLSADRFTLFLWSVTVIAILHLPAVESAAEEVPIEPIDSIAVEMTAWSDDLTLGGTPRPASGDPYFIQRTPVTIGEYRIYLEDTRAATRPAYWSYLSEDPDRTLVGVNLQDIMAFLVWMNAKGNGPIYRLPTEAEWELAYEAGKIEIEPGVGEFLLDYYSESWDDWPIEEGIPIVNPYGPVMGVHGPEEARNFVGVRVTAGGDLERGPVAPDYTGLAFGFRLAWSGEGPGPLGDRLIRQAQMQREAALQPPDARSVVPDSLPQPATPTASPTATQPMVPTATRTPQPSPTLTPVPPSPTATTVAMATPTSTPAPPPAPSATPSAVPSVVPPTEDGRPPFLLARDAQTERFEARGCALEVALPKELVANQFVRLRLTAKNGFTEPKKLLLAISLEVEAIAHIEQGEGFTVYPAGTPRQSLQRPGARFSVRETELPLLELADTEIAAGASRVLEVPIRFSQSGKAIFHVRATFLAATPEPRLDLNLPEMGFPDQLGFPSKAYEIEIVP